MENDMINPLFHGTLPNIVAKLERELKNQGCDLDPKRDDGMYMCFNHYFAIDTGLPWPGLDMSGSEMITIIFENDQNPNIATLYPPSSTRQARQLTSEQIIDYDLAQESEFKQLLETTRRWLAALQNYERRPSRKKL